MAMQREIKKIQEEFKEAVNNSKKELTINHKEFEPFKTDLFKPNFYSKILNKKPQKFIELKKDTELEIEGCGTLNVLISNNLKFKLNFNKKTSCQINIIIQKGISTSILDSSNEESVQKDIQIYQKENSTLKYGFLNESSRLNLVTSFLEKFSTLNLQGAYFADAIQNFIRCEAIHIGESSKSNININGAAINGSKIICDGLIKISSNAKNSEGYQKLNGLLLDDKSTILSEPILEIQNNNVKCSHGASISQIKDEIKFYMSSRGLTEDQITNQITNGYFEEVRSLLKLEEEITVQWK